MLHNITDQQEQWDCEERIAVDHAEHLLHKKQRRDSAAKSRKHGRGAKAHRNRNSEKAQDKETDKQNSYKIHFPASFNCSHTLFISVPENSRAKCSMQKYAMQIPPTSIQEVKYTMQIPDGCEKRCKDMPAYSAA